MRNILERFYRLAKEGSWVVIGQIASLLGALFLVKMLTEELRPDQYGQLGLAMTVVSLINQVLMGGVSAGIGRFYPIAVRNQCIHGYLKASFTLLGGTVVVVVAVALLSAAGLLWLGWQDNMFYLGTSLVVFAILSGLLSSMAGMQNAARNRSVVAAHSGLESILRVGIVLGIVHFFGATPVTVMLGYIVVALVIVSSYLFYLKQLIGPLVSNEADRGDKWLRDIWKFSWPIMAGGIFNWGYYASQRWALELYSTTDEVGKFYVLTQVSYVPVSMAGAVFMAFILPILYGKASDIEKIESLVNVRTLVVKIAGVGVCATLFISTLAYYFHEKIFEVLVSPLYHDISVYMPFVVLAAGILVVSQVLSTSVMVANQTKRFLSLSIFGNSITTIINFIAVANWGLEGLPISMVAGAMIHLIWMIYIIVKFDGYLKKGVADG